MERRHAFNIVIAYENCEAALRSKVLTEELGTELESDCDSWEFELLALERVRESAAAIASEADMIVVAASGERDLPESVKDWIECWLPERKTGRGILVALLSQEIPTLDLPPSPAAYLRWIAERAKMEFLCNVGPGSTPDRMPGPAEMVTSVGE